MHLMKTSAISHLQPDVAKTRHQVTRVDEHRGFDQQTPRRGTSYSAAATLPTRSGNIAERAIGFYNVTALLGAHSGDGELIGVDTFA